MNGLTPLIVAGTPFLGAACTPPSDWIEAMLVTVEVTGMWRGTLATSGGAPINRLPTRLQPQ
jgi:hypothetical protein